jgi:hypothetical protein
MSLQRAGKSRSMLVVSKTVNHVRLACERCEAHTIVRRRTFAMRHTCPVCGITAKVQRTRAEAEPAVAR